ncbi:hypothetical protein CLCR_06375 [Cladophialophora carrionii]|uniref:Uncharacterized protein n=1 Tax=Cladophialophora carrionii TaxID=86049 RepID=A0A1C1C7M5_9EURO|nr:hypothetical protein CLCR_06375 [Cladophialophora carrionii]
MVDTSKHPPGTFSWTIELLRRYNLDRTTDSHLRHEDHEGEYLAAYRLPTPDNSCKHVSFGASVTQGGIFEVMPDLAQAEYSMELYNRLRKFRLQWYLDEKAVSAEEMVTARRLALCFGSRWVPVIMMWALACRARSQHDAFVQYEFRDTFDGWSLNLSPCCKQEV